MLHWLILGLCGGGAGLLNGLLGAGGGMLLVPLLEKLGKLESRQVFPTAMGIMLPLTLCSLVFYGVQGALPIRRALPYVLGGLGGGLLGARLFPQVSPTLLRRLFGLLLLGGGVRLLWKF